MTEYRAECNFGSRYFANAADAITFLNGNRQKILMSKFGS